MSFLNGIFGRKSSSYRHRSLDAVHNLDAPLKVGCTPPDMVEQGGYKRILIVPDNKTSGFFAEVQLKEPKNGEWKFDGYVSTPTPQPFDEVMASVRKAIADNKVCTNSFPILPAQTPQMGMR